MCCQLIRQQNLLQFLTR
uniref:Uncharacterized protein n=1 Tax=Rhizophora mucronata TaxID=61149 RepID=A0A2P2Q0W8_RHIMU